MRSLGKSDDPPPGEKPSLDKLSARSTAKKEKGSVMAKLKIATKWKKSSSPSTSPMEEAAGPSNLGSPSSSPASAAAAGHALPAATADDVETSEEGGMSWVQGAVEYEKYKQEESEKSSKSPPKKDKKRRKWF